MLPLDKMLDNLSGRAHLYILSDGVESEIERALEILGLRHYFREVVGKYASQLPNPDADPYIHARERRVESIRRHGKTKNDFLQHIVAQGYGRILFVDDSQSNIDEARKRRDPERVSTLHVDGGDYGGTRYGLDPKDMMAKYDEFMSGGHLDTKAESRGSPPTS